MVMIVRERRREIGVIKAIGATNFKVMFQFMTEAITLTTMALVIGFAIGILAGNPITKLLVNNSTSSNNSQSFNGSGGGPTVIRTANRGFLGGFHNSISNIHATVGWSIIVYGLLAALFIAIVGSAISSLIISKIRPAEVMRVE
jgi:putative ABC transport system permease protein